MDLWREICGAPKYIRTLCVTIPGGNLDGTVVELYFDNWDSMEAAWANPPGAASDADLPAFADLTRTTWSSFEEITVLG